MYSVTHLTLSMEKMNLTLRTRGSQRAPTLQHYAALNLFTEADLKNEKYDKCEECYYTTNPHLLQRQLIRLPVTAAQLQRFIQRDIQQICSQRLQTQAIIHCS